MKDAFKTDVVTSHGFIKSALSVTSTTGQVKKDVQLNPGGGGELPRILDRGVPRRFVNPNPI